MVETILKGSETMNKGIALVLTLLLVLSLLPAAFANSWGLKGKLLTLVMDDARWENYSTVCNQAGSWAILGSWYHNALFHAAEDGLHVFHTAVWQPDDRKKMSIAETADGFILTCGQESFTFGECADKVVLTQARLGNVEFRADTSNTGTGSFYGYTCTEGTETVFLSMLPLSVSDFNLALFPRTAEDVRRFNLLHAQLDSGENCLGTSERNLIPALGKGTAPVWSAPFGKSAWRAGKGKAAVGLSGNIIPLKGYRNADGDSYTCIEYEVSERTHRIGWVENRLLGSRALEDTSDILGEAFVHCDVRAIRTTFLTDDPFCSQYPQFEVPSGMQFGCMGLVGNDWAYVSAEVTSKGKFTDGGAIVWGFIPVRDLEMDPSFRDDPVPQDIVEQLSGSWTFYAGGSMAEDLLIFYPDGTYEGANTVYTQAGETLGKPRRGTWSVCRYNPFWGFYWDDPVYELTLIHEDGTANVKGLSISEEGFSLTNYEGSGGYVRTEALETEDSEVTNG